MAFQPAMASGGSSSPSVSDSSRNVLPSYAASATHRPPRWRASSMVAPISGMPVISRPGRIGVTLFSHTTSEKGPST
jgi:hypothetical protein